MTHPSHTLQPLLTTRYCLATTHMKCRSVEQSFPLALQGSELAVRAGTAWKAHPASHTRSCGDKVPLQTPTAATCSWSWIRPSFAAELPVAFSRCSSAQPTQNQPAVQGKTCRGDLGGRESQRPGSPPSSQGCRGAARCGARMAAWVLLQVPPPVPRWCPPGTSPPATDVVTLGTLVQGAQLGTQLGAFF